VGAEEEERKTGVSTYRAFARLSWKAAGKKMRRKKRATKHHWGEGVVAVKKAEGTFGQVNIKKKNGEVNHLASIATRGEEVFVVGDEV